MPISNMLCILNGLWILVFENAEVQNCLMTHYNDYSSMFM